MKAILNFLNNIESYVCRALLATFVCLLFTQIISREVFSHSVSWIEELSTYMFVWWGYLGASHAAKMGAHNRVTFQFRAFSKRTIDYIEGIADLFWIFFNVYFIYLSMDSVFNKMNKFWKSQTLGVALKYIYIILPIAFALMTFRVIQVNYLKLVKGVDVRDPEKVDLEELEHELKEHKS